MSFVTAEASVIVTDEATASGMIPTTTAAGSWEGLFILIGLSVRAPFSDIKGVFLVTY